MHADILIFDLTHYDCFKLIALCVPCTGVLVCWLLVVHGERHQKSLALIEVCGCLSGKEHQEHHHDEIGMIRML